MFNEFGVAAFRLHALEHNIMVKANRDLLKTNEFLLSSAFFNASDSYYNVDANARGSLKETTYPLNPQIADSLNNHMFEGVIKPVTNFNGKARSMGAIDIQRGREHGIRAYNDYRELVGLKRAETFDDLLINISPKNLKNLKAYYDNVDDIDMFVGEVSEISLPGAKVGATMAGNYTFSTNYLLKNCLEYISPTLISDLKYIYTKLTIIARQFWT